MTLDQGFPLSWFKCFRSSHLRKRTDSIQGQRYPDSILQHWVEDLRSTYHCSRGIFWRQRSPSCQLFRYHLRSLQRRRYARLRRLPEWIYASYDSRAFAALIWQCHGFGSRSIVSLIVLGPNQMRTGPHPQILFDKTQNQNDHSSVNDIDWAGRQTWWSYSWI